MNSLLMRGGMKKFHSMTIPMTQLVKLLQSHGQSSCVKCARASAAAISTSSKLQFPRVTQFVEPGTTFNPEALTRWERIKWNMGFYGKMALTDAQLNNASYKLYICCTDFLDFGGFVKELDIPDNFTRWFIITTLHVWIVTVKLMQMGREGYLLKQYIYDTMWRDVEKRLKTFPELQGSQRKKEMETLYSLTVTLNLYMDEGIIGSDATLANSLWVTVFDQDVNLAPDKLALMVEYVRKQVYHHDRLDASQVMSLGHISFLPLLGTVVDKVKQDSNLSKLKLFPS